MTLNEAIEKVTALKTMLKVLDKNDKRAQALEIVLEAVNKNAKGVETDA